METVKLVREQVQELLDSGQIGAILQGKLISLEIEDAKPTVVKYMVPLYVASSEDGSRYVLDTDHAVIEGTSVDPDLGDDTVFEADLTEMDLFPPTEEELIQIKARKALDEMDVYSIEIGC